MTTLYITDGTNAQYALRTGLTGTYTEYISPGKTGTWNWYAEKYGYSRRNSSFTPSSGGQVTTTGTWTVDPKISQSNSATVAAYTAISTLDQLYDYSALMRLTYPMYYLCTPTGTQLDFGATNLIFDSTAASVWAYNTGTNTLTVKCSALTEGSALTTIKTTGTLTTANGAIINCLYTSNLGTASSLLITGMEPNSSLWIYDNTGATRIFASGISGDYSYAIEPGAAGEWGWAVESYGNSRQSNTFIPSGIAINVVVKIIGDTGISETNMAVVSAYTNVDTLDKFYDVVAMYRLTSTGIKMGQIATKIGTTLDLGNRGLLVKRDAPDLITSSGLNITIHSNTLAVGTNFIKLTSTPPKLIIADTTETITAAIEDGNGDSSVIINGGSATFDLWQLAVGQLPENYATGTKLATVSNGKFRFIHATGYNIIIRDINTTYLQTISMSKGDYIAGMYFGDQVQLINNNEITIINNKVTTLSADVTSMMGTGFVSANHSLVAASTKLDSILKRIKTALAAIFGLS